MVFSSRSDPLSCACIQCEEQEREEMSFTGCYFFYVIVVAAEELKPASC